MQTNDKIEYTQDYKEQLVAIRTIIGTESYGLVSDDRLIMMLKMTNGDIQETCKMSIGYMIEHLKLSSGNSENTQNIIMQYKQLLSNVNE